MPKLFSHKFLCSYILILLNVVAFGQKNTREYNGLFLSYQIIYEVSPDCFDEFHILFNIGDASDTNINKWKNIIDKNKFPVEIKTELENKKRIYMDYKTIVNRFYNVKNNDVELSYKCDGLCFHYIESNVFFAKKFKKENQYINSSNKPLIFKYDVVYNIATIIGLIKGNFEIAEDFIPSKKYYGFNNFFWDDKMKLFLYDRINTEQPVDILVSFTVDSASVPFKYPW